MPKMFKFEKKIVKCIRYNIFSYLRFKILIKYKGNNGFLEIGCVKHNYSFNNIFLKNYQDFITCYIKY